MGASALVSALNALPWDEEADGSSSDSDDEARDVRQKDDDRPGPSRPRGESYTLFLIITD